MTERNRPSKGTPKNGSMRKLTPHQRNTRTHPKHQLEQLRASFRNVGILDIAEDLLSQWARDRR